MFRVPTVVAGLTTPPLVAPSSLISTRASRHPVTNKPYSLSLRLVAREWSHALDGWGRLLVSWCFEKGLKPAVFRQSRVDSTAALMLSAVSRGLGSLLEAIKAAGASRWTEGGHPVGLSHAGTWGEGFGSEENLFLKKKSLEKQYCTLVQLHSGTQVPDTSQNV